ncbi:MAG: glycosyltransferase family 4 protein [Bacteroidales bacterium]|nr:glycosyltransferase family 4 protein [Bacteroidales bacterium]
MVGNGKLLQHTKDMAKELGVDQNIKFEGYQRDLVHYYQQSKILLMPSRSEGLPTAMLEAMSCGCVPVMSNVGNIKEAAIHNFNAKVIDRYDDVLGFTENIRDLLVDEPKEKVRCQIKTGD